MAAVFPAVGSAIAGLFTGGGVAAAGAATTAAATAGSGVLTLSKVLSAGSALVAIGQGFAARADAKTQAAFAMAEGEQEKAAGASKARDLAKEFASLKSEQEVVQLANGLDLGTGTPQNIGQATQKVADRNIEQTRKNADYRAASARLRARGLLSEGRAALFGGFTKAAGTMIDSYQLTAD
jgi:hypothetical protein